MHVERLSTNHEFQVEHDAKSVFVILFMNSVRFHHPRSVWIFDTCGVMGQSEREVAQHGAMITNKAAFSGPTAYAFPSTSIYKDNMY